MYVLLVDDNKEIVLGLHALFEERGYLLHTASTLHAAKECIDEQSYDLIILDWLLPDGDGVAFLETMRRESVQTPVLMLSSKSEAIEKVEALDAGADDYLQKPFSHIELLARVRALLRRETTQKSSLITLQNLTVNFASLEVSVDGETIPLTKKEFELLELLVQNAGIVLTRYQIEEHLNREFNALKTSNIVDAHIKNLRKKLGSAAKIIKTVRGVGFTIDRE